MDSAARPANSGPGNSIFGRDRRRAHRHRVHTPAYANLGGSAQGAVLELCEILNISEKGACIQASSPLKINRLLPLCLELSETGSRVHVVGHVAWSDASGKTGIRFPEMSEGSRSQIREWLEINNKAEAGASAAQAEQPAPKVNVQPKPTHAVAYTSLVNEWAEIAKEVELCGPDLDPALHLIAQRALTLTWASGTAIALINKLRPSEMICRARAGTDSPEIGARLEAGAGFSGECIRSGSPVTCDDTEYDSRVDRANCRALGVRSIAACPIKRGSETIGILEVFSPEPAAFWENDITVLHRLAEFALLAVRQAEHARIDVLSCPLSDELDLGTPEQSVQDESRDPLSPRMSPRKRLLMLVTGILCLTAITWLIASWMVGPGSSASRFSVPTSAEANTYQETYAATNINDLKRFADEGDAKAQYALGKRYANGDGVPLDYREALHWYLQAGQQGHVRAQGKLAAAFWEGRGGPQDYSRAYFWALLAEAGGDETSRVIVASCAARLTPAQIAAEQKEADQWLHSHNIGHDGNR